MKTNHLLLYLCLDSDSKSDMIQLDIDITNMRFEYSDTDTVSDVEYPDSDTDRSDPPLNGFGLEYDRKISIPFSSLLDTDHTMSIRVRVLKLLYFNVGLEHCIENLVQIRIWIVSTMSDRIRLDINIINM